MGATLVVVCSLLALGFTKEIVGFFIADKQSAKVPTIALAVLALYATDFAINAGEANGSPFTRSGKAY